MRIGTIGSGVIVQSILNGVAATEGISCEAVYSRSREKGCALAEKYGVQKVYTKLEDMMRDEAIDFIYVASPNSLHYGQVKMALEYGKNVICEKPFTPSVEKARELVELARNKSLYLIDAVPTGFLPNLQVLKEQLPAIGRLRLVMCNYSQYSSRYDLLKEGRVTNVFSPEFAGGCLQDINFYNVYFNVYLFGKPCSAVYYPNIYPGLVDTSGVLMMQYDGFVSSNSGAKDTWGVNFIQIEGEAGYIYGRDGSNGLTEIRVVTKQGEMVYNLQDHPDRWLYEVRAIARMVAEDDYEDCCRRQEVMLDVVDTIESSRKAAGIYFSDEKR